MPAKEPLTTRFECQSHRLGCHRYWMRLRVFMALVACVVAASVLAASPVDASSPAAPQNLTTSAVAHNSVTLSWDAPTNSTVTGYVILRRDLPSDGPGEFTEIEDDTGSAATSYTDTTVQAQSRYVYRVKAINGSGTSVWSNYVNVRTPEAPSPSMPARPTAGTVSHDSVTISWSDPGDSSITGYQVLRRDRDTDAVGVFTVIEDDTGSAATSYTDATVAASSRYVYRVKARNVNGLSPQSGFVNVATPAAPEPEPEPEPEQRFEEEYKSTTITVGPKPITGQSPQEPPEPRGHQNPPWTDHHVITAVEPVDHPILGTVTDPGYDPLDGGWGSLPYSPTHHRHYPALDPDLDASEVWYKLDDLATDRAYEFRYGVINYGEPSFDPVDGIKFEMYYGFEPTDDGVSFGTKVTRFGVEVEAEREVFTHTIYDHLGRLLLTRRTVKDTVLWFQPEEIAGAYYLRVYSTEGDTGDYQIWTSSVPVNSVSDADGGRSSDCANSAYLYKWPECSIVATDTVTTVSGMLHSKKDPPPGETFSDYDYYRVFLHAGAKYEFCATTTGFAGTLSSHNPNHPLQPFTHVSTPDGEKVCRTTDVVEWTGWYKIVILARDETAVSGTYTLSAQMLSS